ncbi:MAG: glycosyltransferase family 4 protein [Candidatus Thorarchaeota archaeon]|nr:glycosyltransferase family 4 protein [Candidatus Thorarchaeota archaeon]
MDDLDRMPGKPISEATCLSREFDRVVFIGYNSEGQFLSKRLTDSMFVYTVPLNMTSSLIPTLFHLLTDLTRMGTFVCKLKRLHELDFVRSENAILGGLPSYMAALLDGVKYAIWLAGSEESVIRIRYGNGLLARLVLVLLRFLKSVILSRAVFVLGVSSELVSRAKVLTRGPVFHTPNFVDLDTFVPPEMPRTYGGRIKFLYVGRLEHEKGVRVLLDAIAAIANRDDFEVQIAGWGELLPQVLAAQKESDKIHYLGRFSHSQMPLVYHAAHVLVLASLTEGMPAAVLEAMATGMPVIVSSVGDVPNVVKNGVHGILVTPGSSIELAEAMRSLLDNRHLLAELAGAARSRATQVSGRYIELHRRLYLGLLKHKKRNQPVATQRS